MSIWKPLQIPRTGSGADPEVPAAFAPSMIGAMMGANRAMAPARR